MLPAYTLLLCLGLASANTVTITEFEVPETAKTRESVELKCSYKLTAPQNPLFYVKWSWTSLDSSETSTIYQRLGHKAPQTSHKRLKIKANDTIELVDLQPEDTGIYECEVSNLDEARRKQALFVFTPGTGPLLNASTVEDGPDDTDIVITCEAYDVSPEPELRIIVGSKEEKPKEVELTGPIDGFYGIAANLTLEDVDEGSTISCELLFNNTDVKHEPYIATISYEGSGAALPTTDQPEDTTQWETTTAIPDGSSATLINGLLLLAAALAQLLATN